MGESTGMTRDVSARNVCGSCRHFIDDFTEIAQEIQSISRSNGVPEGVHINTAERIKNHRGIAVGDAVRREVISYKSVAGALARVGLNVIDTGLCEKGVARFVHRLAGSVKGDHRCPHWSERPTLHLHRGLNWRHKRDLALEVRAKLAELPHEMKKGDPCLCGSGRAFSSCCDKHLR